MKNILVAFIVAGCIFLPSISLAETVDSEKDCSKYESVEVKESCLGNYNLMVEKLLAIAKETEDRFVPVEDSNSNCQFLRNASRYYSAIVIFLTYDVNKTVLSTNVEDVTKGKDRVEKKLTDFCSK